jgi:MinD superfamily P-loop ATPase
MKEIIIISGKGGTGKTSLTGAFAALAENPVLADCDVDAADLHLILKPKILETHDFSGGKQARIEPDKCTGCATCEEVCRFGAIRRIPAKDDISPPFFAVDPVACEGCGVCAWFCIPKAVQFEDALNGHWFVSETRFGCLVHAKLGVAEENSGKLVTLVRNRAKQIAKERNCPYLLVDGSPGIGCPVIASLTGADLVVIVTEPTVSGEHDLARVADLAKHFGIPVAVCVNKADINPGMADRIRVNAEARGLSFAGTVPYDKAVTAAQVAQLTIVEHDRGELGKAVRKVWERVTALADGKDTK